MKKIKIIGIILSFLLIISGCGNKTIATISSTTEQLNQEQTTTLDTIPTTIIQGQKLKISYIDVGQADSILIQIPNGKNVLIDAGNNEDADKIISYIKKQGISKLNMIIGTHPHEDHIGAMDMVINSFDIEQVIMPKKDSTTQTFKDVIIAIQNKGLKITEAKSGLKLDLGSEVDTLLIAPNAINYEDVNNCSAVLKLSYGNNTFLFNGDAEDQSENEMINTGFNLKSDVLKVGHHGSNTSSSSAFLSKVQPKYAVISVGKDNSYGHPAQTTIDKLTNIGAKIYRTDQSGTIIVESDGTNITIDTITDEMQPRAPTVNQAPVESNTSISTPVVSPPVVAPAITPSPTPKQTPQDITVYVTKTGAKYHTGGCRYLSKSKIPISLSQAKTSYSPCSVCNPPQ